MERNGKEGHRSRGRGQSLWVERKETVAKRKKGNKKKKLYGLGEKGLERQIGRSRRGKKTKLQLGGREGEICKGSGKKGYVNCRD